MIVVRKIVINARLCLINTNFVYNRIWKFLKITLSFATKMIFAFRNACSFVFAKWLNNIKSKSNVKKTFFLKSQLTQIIHALHDLRFVVEQIVNVLRYNARLFVFDFFDNEINFLNENDVSIEFENEIDNKNDVDDENVVNFIENAKKLNKFWSSIEFVVNAQNVSTNSIWKRNNEWYCKIRSFYCSMFVFVLIIFYFDLRLLFVWRFNVLRFFFAQKRRRNDEFFIE